MAPSDASTAAPLPLKQNFQETIKILSVALNESRRLTCHIASRPAEDESLQNLVQHVRRLASAIEREVEDQHQLCKQLEENLKTVRELYRKR